MKHLYYVLIALLISGCYTEKKATHQVIKAQTHHPNVVASLCGNIYPPIESVRDSIVYKQGETNYRYDTVIVDCDSVINHLPKFSWLVKVPCPPCPVRVDTFYRNIRTVEVNKAKEKQLQQENTMLQATIVREATTKKFLWYAVIILGIYTLVRWVLRIWGIRLP